MSNRYTEGGAWDPNKKVDAEFTAITKNDEMRIELCRMQMHTLAKLIASIQGKPEWLASATIDGITLRREGDCAIVEIERDGVTQIAIKERLDSNFSHHISASGIRSLPQEPIA